MYRPVSDDSTAGRRGPVLGRGSAGLLLALERALLVLGALGILVWAAATARSRVLHARDLAAFDEALAASARAAAAAPDPAEPAPDMSEWSEARVKAYHAAATTATPVVGRLSLPTIQLAVMVLDGTDEWTLNRGVGRIEGTARPGEKGNLGVAGHRDGFFRGLRKISKGDPIVLTTLKGTYRYRVQSIDIVRPDDVSVLEHDDGPPTLTLVTCYPFWFVGDAPLRYIVTARQAGPPESPAVNEASR